MIFEEKLTQTVVIEYNDMLDLRFNIVLARRGAMPA